MTLGLGGIVASLVLLMALAYRGISVLILAPALALLAVSLGGGESVLGAYTQIFMSGLGGFLTKYFPLFLLGAIFGKLMDDSGSARAMASWIVGALGDRHAVAAVVVACALLTYGGVSLFVVAFAVYPIGAALFRRADVPKRLLPAAIALGSFTFTMTALPGTPAIQNAIPMPFFGTDAFAAPGLGLIGAAIMLIGGIAWLTWRRHETRCEGYGDHVSEAAPIEAAAPPLLVAVLPLVVVLVVNLAFSRFLLPRIDSAFLATSKYGGVSLQSVQGIWAIIAALTIAIVVAAGMHRRRIKSLVKCFNDGALGSLLPVLNTASEVGYGKVVASLAAFAVVRDATIGLAPDNPLVGASASVTILAGITGSASGGLSIALSALGDQFSALPVDPELLHRVVAMASGGLDTLPHNGAVITLLTICGLTHRQSYADVFVVAVIVPLLALASVIALGTTVGSF